MAMDNKMMIKGRICVTGGTGYYGSWIVKRLLEDGYSVNATTRLGPEGKRDISYLTNLPGASERLKIFDADLDKPESFVAAIEGCDGVFHMAHPLDFENNESEETKTKRVISGTQGILQACIDSKTVRRVVYTSSVSAVAFNGLEQRDESCWTDADFARSLGVFLGPYAVTKTLAEKAALEFAEKNGLDLVSILPCLTTGPFITPNVPETVHICSALILGDKKRYTMIKSTGMVHIDDVARAHIHLFEHPKAKGRYLCTGVQTSIEELCEFISTRYPEYKMPTPDTWKDVITLKLSGIPSKKLLQTGFKYEKGLEEMFEDAIKCCKEKDYF